jgi:PIN domain nuclease of toxin-antitoxin system
MRVLLDTHAFLWFVIGSPELSSRARDVIEDAAIEKFLSVASLWEMAIKASLGKIILAKPFDVLIPGQISAAGFSVLGLEIDHITAVAVLPFHYRDPFDRMLVAQAKHEEMSIVSSDTQLDSYEIERIW